VAITLADAAGNPVTGDQLDAGSVTATFVDGTELSATVSADQTSVNVKALGPLTVDDVLTVTGSLNGVALSPGTLAFDVGVGSPASIVLAPGTPVENE
jgi:uncharacterized YccA/Bax inhibitor family protein